MPVPRRNQRVIGIQVIGGADDECKLVGVVTDLDAKRVAAEMVEPIQKVSASRAIDAIERLIYRLVRDKGPEDRVVGIGIEIGGVIHDGVVVHAPALGWQNERLVRNLSRVFDYKVVLVNDANALAIYERDFAGEFGATDLDHFVVVLITELGIGLGAILSGQLYEGTRGVAGELGHVVIEDRDPLIQCQCGKHGCLQTVATISGIAKALDAEDFKGGFHAALTQPDDEKVVSVFTKAGAALGKGLSSVVNLLNPSTIVIYGQSSLIGHPRHFNVAATDNIEGAASHYVGAMIENLKAHVFERAADCTILIRTEVNHRGAEAAAACAIDSVRPSRPQ